MFGCAVITGVGAVVNTADLPPDRSVAVVGLGGVGLAALMGARLREARRIVAIDLSDAKLAAARELVAAVPGAASQAILGDALLRAGQLADAEDAFRAGTTVDPKSTVCWNGLGTAALNRWIAGGKVDSSARARAVAAFEASLAVDGDQPKVVRLMASHGL